MRRADPETHIQHTEPLLSVCQDTALQLGQPLTKAHTFTKCDNTTVTWNKINHIFFGYYIHKCFLLMCVFRLPCVAA